MNSEIFHDFIDEELSHIDNIKCILSVLRETLPENKPYEFIDGKLVLSGVEDVVKHVNDMFKMRCKKCNIRLCCDEIKYYNTIGINSTDFICTKHWCSCMPKRAPHDWIVICTRCHTNYICRTCKYTDGGDGNYFCEKCVDMM